MRLTPLMTVTALAETGTGFLRLVRPALVFALLFDWRQHERPPAPPAPLVPLGPVT